MCGKLGFAQRQAEKMAEEAVVKEHGMDTGRAPMEMKEARPGHLSRHLQKVINRL